MSFHGHLDSYPDTDICDCQTLVHVRDIHVEYEFLNKFLVGDRDSCPDTETGIHVLTHTPGFIS